MAKHSETRRVLLIFMLAAGVIESTVKIPAPMLAIMNASRASSTRSVLMYSPSDTESFYVIAKELPIPMKFLPTSSNALKCEFDEYIPDNVDKCYLTQTLHEVHNQRSLIFLADAWFDQPRFMKRKISSILYEQPKRLLILGADSHIKTLRYFAGRLCNVITVTTFDINFPKDYYRRCNTRRQGNVLAFLGEKLPAALPKDNIYKASLRDGPTYARLPSEALALLDAYKTLNNTIEEVGRRTFLDVREKRVDISLPPFPATILHEYHVFTGAHYVPCPICFFTAKQKASGTMFRDSWGSLLWFTGGITIQFLILVVYMDIRCRIFCGGDRRRHNSLLLMFFVTTLFGKSPSPATVYSLTFRGLASVSWVIGMLVVGFYIQSSITAIRLVPMEVPVVRSYQDLFHFAKTGTLIPCYNRDWEGYFFSSPEDNDMEFRDEIAMAGKYSTQLIYRAGGFSVCYRRTQARTHVALSVCTDEETEAASKWKLVPGDHFLTTIRAPAIHVTNPHRRQHRRLLLAIWEHGLATPHRRFILPQTLDKEETKEPLSIYLVPYVIGCIISCLSLCFEIAAQAMRRRLA